jgi:hypothetical protein
MRTSKCPQKCDQLFPFPRFQLQAEFVARDGPSAYAGRAVSSWDVGLLQPVRIEHLFEARDGTVVKIVPPIPYALE